MKVKLKKHSKVDPYKPQNVCNNSRMSWQEAGALYSAPVASKNSNKNFDLMADNEINNNLEISIYLANLNPPYKNLLFLPRVLNILTVRSKLALQDEIHLP